MEDQQSDPGDLTTEDSPAAARPRRRFFGRRSAPKVAAGQAAADDTAAVQDTGAEPPVPEAPKTPPVPEAPKTPMGKSARVSRARTGTDPAEAADEPQAEGGTVTASKTAEPAEAVVQPGSAPRDEDETVVPTDSEPGAEPGSGAESDLDTVPESEPAPESEPVPEAEPVVMVPHRPAGRKALAVAAVASVVFVGAGAFAAAMVQPYLSERALVQTKLDIAQAATDAITTLWTYTPDDMASLADRASGFLGGDFAEEYRRYIDAIVEPNKQAQVTNTTQVMGAAVESVSPASIPTEATALVYTNSIATSPVTKNIPALRYLSYRLEMQREGSDWRIVRMSTITSFDLTPQL